MRERSQALLFVTFWGISLLLIWGAVAAIAPKPVAPVSALSVRLVIHGSTWTINYEASTRNNTAFGLLREANVTMHFELRWVEYGWPYNDVFVTSINGTTNDQGRDLWWQYCVNGAYASQGALSQALQDGDAVKWAYAPPGGNNLCG